MARPQILPTSQLFTFGAAAFVIEHPGPGAETEPASLAGVRSVLKAYEVMLGRGGSRSAVLDELRQKDQSGTLEAHVAAAWTKCRGQGA